MPFGGWADKIRERYGTCSDVPADPDENPYRLPMRIYPAVHYTMGGLWVDYDLMSFIRFGSWTEKPILRSRGQWLGASVLMQGLADGYFILPYTIGTTRDIN
jgi:succinate dehydrogenase / fumarate reductase flavoprotein subunit